MTINISGSSLPAGRVTGFVPVVAPATGTVQVVLLQSKRTEKNGDSDPRPKSTDRYGNFDGTRNQVIMDLVGVVVDGVCYPGHTEATKLPELGSEEYLELIARPCGIRVEALYSGGVAKIRAAMVKGVPMPFDLATLDKAVSTGTVSNLFRTAGAALRALGLIETQEWTIGDILFCGKSITVNLLAAGEGDAYAAGFTELRGTFGFPSVAFVASMGTTLQATDLNGRPSYTASRVYFKWHLVAGVMGRQVYKLDPAYAISGASFAILPTRWGN